MVGRKPSVGPLLGARSHHGPPKLGAIADGNLTKPPRWLTKSEKTEFREILRSAPRGLLRLADGAAVARLAVSRAAFHILHDEILKVDAASKEAATLRRLLAQESTIAIRLEGELGFGSPTARRRVFAEAPRDSEQNDFASFLEQGARLHTRSNQ